MEKFWGGNFDLPDVHRLPAVFAFPVGEAST